MRMTLLLLLATALLAGCDDPDAPAKPADKPATTTKSEAEEESEWDTVWSEEHQRNYFVHRETQATQWELPA